MATEEQVATRIRNDDVREAFEKAQEAAVEVGVKGAENWSLYMGNSTKEGYQAWIDARSGARRGRPLGTNKRQVKASLLAMAEAFTLVSKSK